MVRDEERSALEEFFRTLSTEMLDEFRCAYLDHAKEAIRRPRGPGHTADYYLARVDLIGRVLSERGVEVGECDED